MLITTKVEDKLSLYQYNSTIFDSMEEEAENLAYPTCKIGETGNTKTLKQNVYLGTICFCCSAPTINCMVVRDVGEGGIKALLEFINII